MRGTRIRRLLAGTIIGCALSMVIGPAAAFADVTLGSSLPVPDQTRDCVGSPDCVYDQASLPGAQLVAPSDGTITHWALRGSTGTFFLRIMRPAAGGQYTFVTTGPTLTPPDTGINGQDVSIPVKQGDVVGVGFNSGSTLGLTTNLGANYNEWTMGPHADGDTSSPDGSASGELLYQATFNPKPPVTPPPATPAPTITNVSIHPCLPASHRHRATCVPRSFSSLAASFTLSQNARVVVRVDQVLGGRIVRGGGHAKSLNRCVPPTASNRSHQRCEIYMRYGRIRAYTRSAGGVHFRVLTLLRAVQPKFRHLPPGTFRISFHAQNANGTSAVSFVRFAH